METVTAREVPFSETELVRSTAHPRLSWGAVFAGAVVALAVWAMLYALGLAVGLLVLNPDTPSTLRASSIFTGIWGMIAPLLSLFVGGLVASRCAGVVRRLDGAIHGLVMWGLATVAGAWLVGSVMATLVGGAASMGKTSLEGESARGETTTHQMVAAPMMKAREAAESLGKSVAGAPPTPAQRETLRAAEGSWKAFGGMFGALFLGMVSAVAGAVVGLTRRRGEGKVVTTTTTTPSRAAPPVATEREVYP
jgi:hypothetical protein